MKVEHASSYRTPLVSGINGMPLAEVKAVVIVTAFCSGGRITDRCQYDSYPKVDNGTMIKWARGVAAGLRALHKAGATHRNLNPGNVHLDARGRAVVTGFQCLRTPRKPGDAYSMGRNDCGTPAVIAPEVEDGHPVSPAADIWAFGCCLFAWMTSQPTLVQGVMRDMPITQVLRRIPKRFGEKLRAALRMCLQHHPDHRATADDLWRMLSTSRT